MQPPRESTSRTFVGANADRQFPVPLCWRCALFVGLTWISGGVVLAQEQPALRELALPHTEPNFGPQTYGPFGRWFAVHVSEGQIGEDLNGDGDLVDSVLHVVDLETDRRRNLLGSGPALFAGGPARRSDENVHMVFEVNEAAQGTDLNGDDDLLDTVAIA